MRYLSILIFILFIFPTAVQAHTIIRVDYTCPIDGITFTEPTTGSDTTYGTMLDLQPVGGGFYPWPVAKCPNDGMVMYKEKFTPEETTILKSYIATPEYQKMAKEETSYWLIAKIKEKLGVPLNERWYTLLQATWQADYNQYNSYTRETISVVETLLANPQDQEEKSIETLNLLLGELYRRIGDFEKAKSIFDDLITKPAFKNHSFYPLVIEYELELIAAKDNLSHKIPDLKDEIILK